MSILHTDYFHHRVYFPALSDNQGLLFHGPVGTGKTYTAACIANALLDKEISVIMTSFVKILQEIQNTGVDEGVYIFQFPDAEHFFTLFFLFCPFPHIFLLA